MRKLFEPYDDATDRLSKFNRVKTFARNGDFKVNIHQ